MHQLTDTEYAEHQRLKQLEHEKICELCKKEFNIPFKENVFISKDRLEQFKRLAKY